MISRRTLFSNSLSILVNRLAQSLSAFAVVALVARSLGAHALGQYMLAFSFYFLAMTIVSQGFKTLFTREMAKDRAQAGDYLLSGSVLQLGCALLGYGALVGIVAALPYSAETEMVCYLFGAALIPFALHNVTEAVFQAFDRMYLIAISTVPVYILRVLVIWLALGAGYGIERVCVIMVASEVVVLLVEWLFVLRLARPARRIDTGFIRAQIAKARTLVAIEGMAVVRGRTQIMVLSVMGGEVLVGLYGAMMQLLQPFLIASQSLVTAVFPSMVKSAALGPERQRKLTAGIIEMLLMVSIPFVIALAWIGDRLLILVYKDPNFASAATPLAILAVGLLASSFNRALSFVLVANGHERVNLREVITTTILGVTLSVILVRQYGLIGAAIAEPIVATIAFAQYSYAVHKRLFALDYLRILARPLLVGVAMQAAFIALTRSGQNLITILVVTALPCCAAVAWFALRGGHRAQLKPAVPLAGEG